MIRGRCDRRIHLDNNATTCVDLEVLEAMLPYLRERCGNPSSACATGREAAAAVARARERVAALAGCDPGEIVFTSGGTESNNAAVRSALRLWPARRHLVLSAVEHSSIRNLGESLAGEGYEITWLGVAADGRIDPGAAAAALRPDTALLAVMWANNETGVLAPVAELAEIARGRGVAFHTDAVQAVGKVPVDLRGAGVTTASISAHKLHGPKGVGALFVGRASRFLPLLVGGEQEGGRRAGTENVPGIVAFGRAAELAMGSLRDMGARVRELRDRLERGLLERVPGARCNGHVESRVPNTSNLTFEGIEAEGALILLDGRGICCSAGSACTTGALAPSHVLTAMGVGREAAKGSLRFSLSRYTTREEIERALAVIPDVIARLRDGSWRGAAGVPGPGGSRPPPSRAE